MPIRTWPEQADEVEFRCLWVAMCGIILVRIQKLFNYDFEILEVFYMEYTYNTTGTCSQRIDFDMDENGKVTNISFLGGCNGNLKAISKLVDGWTADEIADKLLGNTCGPRPTSCADQLARAVMLAQQKQSEGK